MNKSKKLILVVDTQYDFMMSDGRLPVPHAEEIIVPGIRFLAELKPAATAGVVFTFDTHTRQGFPGSPENLGDASRGRPGFPLHCEKGTSGWENVFNPRLVPAGIPVFRLEKGVFDPWEEPNPVLAVISDGEAGTPHVQRRDDFFAPERAGAGTVAVIGVASDYCVKWTVAGLLARGFGVEVIGALTRGIAQSFEQVKKECFAGQAVRVV